MFPKGVGSVLWNVLKSESTDVLGMTVLPCSFQGARNLHHLSHNGDCSTANMSFVPSAFTFLIRTIQTLLPPFRRNNQVVYNGCIREVVRVGQCWALHNPSVRAAMPGICSGDGLPDTKGKYNPKGDVAHNCHDMHMTPQHLILPY